MTTLARLIAAAAVALPIVGGSAVSAQAAGCSCRLPHHVVHHRHIGRVRYVRPYAYGYRTPYWRTPVYAEEAWGPSFAYGETWGYPRTWVSYYDEPTVVWYGGWRDPYWRHAYWRGPYWREGWRHGHWDHGWHRGWR